MRSNTDCIFTVRRGWECQIVDFGKLQKSLDTFPQIQTSKKMWGIPKLFNLPTNNSHEPYWLAQAKLNPSLIYILVERDMPCIFHKELDIKTTLQSNLVTQFKM